MADSIELKIKVTGGQDAIRELERLQTLKKDLEHNRLELRMDKHQVEADIHDIQKKIRDVKEELAKDPDNESLKAKLKELQDQLADAKEKAADLGDAMNFKSDAISQTNEDIAKLKEAAEDAASVFESLGAAIEKVGDAVSFLGDLSQLSADFSGAVADAFGGMSDLFSFDFFDKITDSLANVAADAFVGDFEKIVSRYDIMNTFVDYMKVAGVDQITAETALERINKSILGIPIGLDESAFRLRKYQMFLEDIDKATNLTIGVQNAIMAGGANQQMKTLAFTQIDRLIATGTLNNPRQWISLFNGLGVSLKYVAQEMGVAGMSAQDLANGLSKGDIPIQDLLDALMRIGEGSSVAGQEITKLLDLYRTQAQSWLENIGFAATRGAVNVMDALDQVLFERRGTNIVSYLERVRNAINDLYGKPGSGTGITGWIEANPEKVETGISAIERLFGALGTFDLEKFGEGALGNLTTLLNIITDGLERVPDGKAEEFASFATTLAGPLSDFLKSAGDMPWMLAVYNEFKDHDLGGLVETTLDMVEDAAGVFSTFLGLFSPEVLDWIVAFGAVWGQPVADALHAVGGGISDFAVGVAALKYAGILELAAKHADILAFAGALAAVAGAIGVYFLSVENKKANLREQLGLDDIYDLVNTANNAVEEAEKARKDYNAKIDQIVGEAESTRDLIKRIWELNDEVSEQFAEHHAADPNTVKELADAIEQYNSLPYEDITQKLTAYSGGLDAASRSVLENAQAEIDAQQKRAEAIAAEEYLIDSSKKVLELRGQLYSLQREQSDLEQSIAYNEAEMQAIIDKAGGDVHRLGLDAYMELETPGANREEKQKALAAVESQMAEIQEELDATLEERRFVLTVPTDIDIDTDSESMSISDAAASGIGQVAGALQTIDQTDPSVTEKLDAVAESIGAIAENGDALETINDIIEPLNSLVTTIGGGEDGEEVSLAQSIAFVQELIQEAIDNEISNFLIALATLKSAFDDAKQSCDDLKKAIEEMANKASEKISTLDSFKEGLYRVSSAAFAATESVNALKAAIDSLEDKTVTVTYQEVHTGFAAAPMYEANGGPIYLAGGGGPRGTDTIPAWLSPGEFVMRRRAVDRFGAGFMSMINNLNIPGALGELMARASIPGLGGIVSYDNRRTYDDHSTKNINVHTNSPSYAMRFASRYV